MSGIEILWYGLELCLRNGELLRSEVRRKERLVIPQWEGCPCRKTLPGMVELLDEGGVDGEVSRYKQFHVLLRTH